MVTIIQMLIKELVEILTTVSARVNRRNDFATTAEGIHLVTAEETF